jgi:hypothetical protein
MLNEELSESAAGNGNPGNSYLRVGSIPEASQETGVPG